MAFAVGATAFLTLGWGAMLVVIRRVGWWSLVIPYLRPSPFFGYWLWVFYAPPGRKGGWTDWAAWVAVLSPLPAAIIW